MLGRARGLTFCTAALLGAFAGVAHAETIVDFNLQTATTAGDAGSATHSNTAPAGSATINPTPSAFNISSGTVLAETAPNSTSGVNLSPLIAPGASYVALLAGTTASVNVNGATSFGFVWGSIDTYNSVKVTDVNGTSYTLTGTELQTIVSGSFGAQTTEAAVYFTDAVGIASVQFIDVNSNAFEIAAVSQTPLPPAVFLFGTALAGLTWFGRRRQSGGMSMA